MVSPGIIDTGNMSADAKKELIEMIPVKTLGVPANVSQAVLYILSDENNYLNGANIVVSGGWSG
jgi:3-oxoacyl-[acyl-carrier protein] reductase